MSTQQSTYLIIGAALAGAKAAEALREEGFDGRVVLVGSEPARPYERPPLSKEYLRGEASDPPYVHDQDFYEQQRIELLLGRTVTRLLPGESRAELDDGSSIAFERALLATGAEPRALPVPGADLDGVHLLRTIGDSDALRARIDAGGRVVVVGAGWIGSEVAASARQKGCEVTVFEPQSVPLERVLGPEVGSFYARLHERNGVRLRLGEGIDGFEGDGGRVRAARAGSGELVECDFAVVGIGVTPRVALAADAGLEVGDGVLVDSALRTSAPNVFAAGDVAGARHPFYGRHIRVEHWGNALEQGAAAGRSMAGADVGYDLLPYFFSDQYDAGMEYRGLTLDGYDEVVFRGDPEGGEFVAFWLRDGTVQAAMNVNVWDVGEPLEALIRARRPVDRAALADPDTPYADLLSGAPS